MQNNTRNIYYVHDDGSSEMLCGNDLILLDSEFVELVSSHQWSIGSHGYATSGAGKNQVLLHRLIIDAKKGESVDHINQNKLDNRIANLRVATIQQNSINRPKQINNTSGYKGVCRLSDGTWQAQIGYKGESIYLGKYNDALTATEAYDIAAKTLFGEYAHLNGTDIPNHENKDFLEKLKVRRKKLTYEQVSQVRFLHSEGFSIIELANIFNRSYSGIRRIVNYKTFTTNGR